MAAALEPLLTLVLVEVADGDAAEDCVDVDAAVYDGSVPVVVAGWKIKTTQFDSYQ